MKKPFGELNEEEATALARKAVRCASSEEDLRKRLQEAGFDAEAAAIHSDGQGLRFRAMVMLWGPRGEVINA